MKSFDVHVWGEGFSQVNDTPSPFNLTSLVRSPSGFLFHLMKFYFY
jgi:hypothetical protein